MHLRSISSHCMLHPFSKWEREGYRINLQIFNGIRVNGQVVYIHKQSVYYRGLDTIPYFIECFSTYFKLVVLSKCVILI